MALGGSCLLNSQSKIVIRYDRLKGLGRLEFRISAIVIYLVFVFCYLKFLIADIRQSSFQTFFIPIWRLA